MTLNELYLHRSYLCGQLRSMADMIHEDRLSANAAIADLDFLNRQLVQLLTEIEHEEKEPPAEEPTV